MLKFLLWPYDPMTSPNFPSYNFESIQTMRFQMPFKKVFQSAGQWRQLTTHTTIPTPKGYARKQLRSRIVLRCVSHDESCVAPSGGGNPPDVRFFPGLDMRITCKLCVLENVSRSVERGLATFFATSCLGLTCRPGVRIPKISMHDVAEVPICHKPPMQEFKTIEACTPWHGVGAKFNIRCMFIGSRKPETY